MAINTYKCSFETDLAGITSLEYINFVDKAVSHIRENGGLPNFNLPSFYRCNVTYIRLNAGDKIGRWRGSFQYYILDEFQVRRKRYSGINVDGHILQMYQYNNENPSSGFVKSKLTDCYDELVTPLLNDSDESPDSDKEIKFSGLTYVDDTIFDFENNEELQWDPVVILEFQSNTRFKVDIILRYSDDDPSAGDEYVEPEKPKKIYLANLDFGYRRSRRNNKNRRKYRNYRNRY